MQQQREEQALPCARVKHAMSAESPSRAGGPVRRRDSPAVKRRKMQTPARAIHPAAGEAGRQEDNPARCGGSARRGGRKTLFDTPDSKDAVKENRRPCFASGAGKPVDTPASSDGSAAGVAPRARHGGARSSFGDVLNRSNVNPFCRDAGGGCRDAQVPNSSSSSRNGGRVRASTAEPLPQASMATPPRFPSMGREGGDTATLMTSGRAILQGQATSSQPRRLNRSSLLQDSLDDAENSMYFSSPSTTMDNSRRYSRCDSGASVLSLGSDSPLEGASARAASARAARRRSARAALETKELAEKRQQQRYARDDEEAMCSSPTGHLCNKLERTCSLRDEAESPAVSAQLQGRGQGQRADKIDPHGDVLIDEDDDDNVKMAGAALPPPAFPALAAPPLRFHEPCAPPNGLGNSASPPAAVVGERRATPPTPCKDEGPVSSGASRDLGGGGGGSTSRYKEEFEELGVLGGGSFGTVYKCKNRLDGCMYAVKMTKQRFKSRAGREQVLKEVYALSAMCNAEENPHIVRYFSAFIEDGRLFIQTELCDKSLSDMMRDGQVGGSFAALNRTGRELARQVLDGLTHLHKYNLVHLDIKPANIFVKNGTFKLGDLGHACLSRIKRGNSINFVGVGCTSAADFVSSVGGHSSGNNGSAPMDMPPTLSPVPHHRSPSLFQGGMRDLGHRGLMLGESAALMMDEDSLMAAGERFAMAVETALPAPPPLEQSLLPAGSNLTSTTATSLANQHTPERPPRATGETGTPVLSSDEGNTPKSSASSHASFNYDINEGDQRYMAPEILVEAYEHLAKADVFSLGATLYEICLGHELPANGPEWHEIRKDVLDPASLSRFTPDLQDLVRRMMHHDPARRPSAEALVASGGPGGVLRTEWECKLAREKAAADEYRKQLARLKPSTSSRAQFDLDSRYRFRRSNTM